MNSQNKKWEQADHIARMINGTLFLGKTQAEKDREQANRIRERRNRLLTATDWTQVPDSPLYNNAEILNYRQQLRDISDNPEFPYIELPIKPKEL